MVYGVREDIKFEIEKTIIKNVYSFFNNFNEKNKDMC